MRALPATKAVGWAKIDAKPLKKALEMLVSKWSFLYIKYLQVRHSARHCGYVWLQRRQLQCCHRFAPRTRCMAA